MTDLQRLYDSGYVVLNTRQLLDVLKQFKSSNMAINVPRLERDIDPEGLHLMFQMLLHNDSEWRCRLLIKVRNRKEPVELVQDISMDMWDRLRSNFRVGIEQAEARG